MGCCTSSESVDKSTFSVRVPVCPSELVDSSTATPTSHRTEAISGDLLTTLVNHIRKGDLAQRNHALHILDDLLDVLSVDQVYFLWKQNCLNMVLRWLRSVDRRLRYRCIRVAHIITYVVPAAKLEFLQKRGHYMLVELLASGITDELELKEVASFVVDCITSEDSESDIHACLLFEEAMLQEVLRLTKRSVQLVPTLAVLNKLDECFNAGLSKEFPL